MPPPPARTARSSSRSSKRSDPPDDREPTIAIADVGAAHGLRGLLRVRPYQPGPTHLTAGATVLLEQHGTRRPCRVVSAAPHGAGLVLVGFEGVSDRTAAEALRGARVLVPTADLPPAEDDEFYWHEVAGFTVATVDGRILGEVSETFSTGLNDVWVVRGATGEHLIPVIADVVRSIDRDARRIVIEPMPGLLD